MRQTEDNESDDGWYDESDEEPDEGYIPCPHCGETMLEAADHCPACNRWITAEDMQRKQNSWWVIAIIVILLFTMVLSVVPL